MSCKFLLNQLTKLSYVNIFKNNGFTSSKGVTTSTLLNTVTRRIFSYNFVNQYCSLAKDIQIVSYEDVKQLTKRPEILLIDVREPQELQETGQIPTSINIPLEQIAKELGPNVDNTTFKAKYGRNKPDKDTEIIFHCKIGKRSQNAAELARSLGYQNTKNYLGSWTEWAEKEGLSQ